MLEPRIFIMPGKGVHGPACPSGKDTVRAKGRKILWLHGIILTILIAIFPVDEFGIAVINLDPRGKARRKSISMVCSKVGRLAVVVEVVGLAEIDG